MSRIDWLSVEVGPLDLIAGRLRYRLRSSNNSRDRAARCETDPRPLAADSSEELHVAPQHQVSEAGLVQSAFSTSRLIASGLDGLSSCTAIQASRRANASGGMRTVTGVALTAGRPIFFPMLETLDAMT